VLALHDDERVTGGGGHAVRLTGGVGSLGLVPDAALEARVVGRVRRVRAVGDELVAQDDAFLGGGLLGGLVLVATGQEDGEEDGDDHHGRPLLGQRVRVAVPTTPMEATASITAWLGGITADPIS